MARTDGYSPSSPGLQSEPSTPRIHRVTQNGSSNNSLRSMLLPQQTQRRSCTECCRRKVRCNRMHPCANCLKYKSTCIFPKFRRPARNLRRKDDQNNEPSDMSNGLEGRVRPARDSGNVSELCGLLASSDAVRRHSMLGMPSDPTANPNDGMKKADARDQLVHDRHRSRYVSNSFWATLSSEVDEMHDILDGSTPEPDEESEQRNVGITPRMMQASRETFVFSPLSTAQTVSSLYPSAATLLTMFDLFQENVDPVVRIFHRPTLRKTMTEALSNFSELDRHVEVVMFSLCYAAVTSLDESDTKRLLGEDQEVLLRRYRFATEQSLARAGFLESQNLAVLAALVLYLICVRRHDQTRFVSGLLGVVIRNAQGMGLHKDGLNFRLSPLETENRRRLWWHICVLDLRTSEDHGCDPSLFDDNYDTKFPLNINDDDISCEDLEARPQSLGTSDMTFCLLRFEVTIAIRKLHYHPPGAKNSQDMDPAQLQQSMELTEKHFHEQYIKYCDPTRSIDWVSAIWARLMLAKMWLAVCNRLPRQDGKVRNIPLHSRHLAFTKSIEVLELADLLETGHRAARWRWLFLTHTQWHAVVFVLAYLCARPNDTLSGRAWSVVNKVYRRWTSNVQAKKGMLWKPARRLMCRANQVRMATASAQPTSIVTPMDSTYEANMFTPSAVGYESDHHQFEQNPTPSSEILSTGDTRLNRQGDIHAAPAHPSPLSEQRSSEELSGNFAPVMPRLASDAIQSFDPTEPQLGVEPESVEFGSEMGWLDWANVMEELQLDMQDIEEIPTVCSSEMMQGGIRNFWNTL